MATEVGNLIIKVDTSDVKAAESELGRLNKTAQQTNNTTKEMPAAARGAAKGFTLMKGGSQQLSYQLQDVAVQAQSGTNALVILAQQGPQIASVFGPVGAAFGAVIAFGALFGGLAIKMLSAGSSADSLREKIRDLGLEFRQLSAAQQALISAQLIDENKELFSQTERLELKLANLTAGYEAYREGLFVTEKGTKKYLDAMNLLSAEIELNKKTMQENTDILSGNSVAVKDRIKSLELEAATLGESARQQAIINAQAEGASELQIAEINRIYDRIEAKEREMELDKQAAIEKAKADADAQKAAEKKRIDDEKAAEQAKASAWSLTEGLLEAEDALLKGKSEKQKAGFRLAVNLANAEKRENAKKIISSSYAAAMDAYKALAGIPIIGPILGAAAFAGIVGLGVSSAASSLSGRALGGQVRGGESYIVGERGPEVLTMGGNGRITPNEALRGGSGQTVNKTANVSFNIQANDTTGFDELLNNRRGQIIGIINEALNDQGKAALA
jgi:hypothetical protein